MKAYRFESRVFPTNPLRISIPEFSLPWLWRQMKRLVVIPLFRRFLEWIRPQINDLIIWVFTNVNATRGQVEEAVEEWLRDLERKVEDEL